MSTQHPELVREDTAELSTVPVTGERLEEAEKAERIGVRTWSPAQIATGAIGLLLTVMGGVALARLLPTSSLTGETTVALGVTHTPLMAVITTGIGVLYLTQVSTPYEAKPGLISLGVINLAFGLIVAIEPGAFDGALGLGSEGGLFYAAIGLVSVIVGLITPTLFARWKTEQR